METSVVNALEPLGFLPPIGCFLEYWSYPSKVYARHKPFDTIDCKEELACLFV